jgi:hypothetical protein
MERTDILEMSSSQARLSIAVAILVSIEPIIICRKS